MNPLPRPPSRPIRCGQPVLLRGSISHVHPATGEVLGRYSTSREPAKVLAVACKTRRASRCLPCAETYRADTYQLVRAGLSGGKGIPASVADHPAVFVTLTAPSFGFVHTRREGKGQVRRCRSRRGGETCSHGAPLVCNERHGRDDPKLGEPLCPDCYDYDGSVLFNALAPELWRRFTISLHRTMARQAGLTAVALAKQLRISYAKVAEYQKRGVVHFHAIIRLDGPAGPCASPPAWATTASLAATITRAARVVRVRTPAGPGHPARTLAWGGEHDIRVVTASGDLTDSRVAGYVAKYATKAAETTGTPDRRIATLSDLATLAIRPHPRRLSATCLRLGQISNLEPLRLTQWAHMLGFRGHFSTKSRHYSVTLGALRAARIEYQRQSIASLLPEPDDTTLVVAHWSYAGRGHPSYYPDPPLGQPPGSESSWT